MKDKIKEIKYPKHKHPHGVENTPPNECRIWQCEECGYIFSDDEIREDAGLGWGHICRKTKCRCESHLEPYIPDIKALLPQGDENRLLIDEEIKKITPYGLISYMPEYKKIAKAQKALDDIKLKERDREWKERMDDKRMYHAQSAEALRVCGLGSDDEVNDFEQHEAIYNTLTRVLKEMGVE